MVESFVGRDGRVGCGCRGEQRDGLGECFVDDFFHYRVVHDKSKTYEIFQDVPISGLCEKPKRVKLEKYGGVPSNPYREIAWRGRSPRVCTLWFDMLDH